MGTETVYVRNLYGALRLVCIVGPFIGGVSSESYLKSIDIMDYEYHLGLSILTMCI